MIKKEQTIAEIFQNYPQHIDVLSEILLDYGLHCVSCHANSFETLEEGTMGHGMDEEVVEQMIKELNEIVKDEKPTVSN